jgi:uncharacterized protein YciI
VQVIYAFVLLDKAGAQDLRAALRPEHRAYVAQARERIAFAGPLVGDDGEVRIGSLLAIDFPSREEATAWLRDEPFTKGGLYASVQIHAFLNFWEQKAGFPMRREQ